LKKKITIHNLKKIGPKFLNATYLQLFTTSFTLGRRLQNNHNNVVNVQWWPNCEQWSSMNIMFHGCTSLYCIFWQSGNDHRVVDKAMNIIVVTPSSMMILTQHNVSFLEWWTTMRSKAMCMRLLHWTLKQSGNDGKVVAWTLQGITMV
jgi:hypothetical protein